MIRPIERSSHRGIPRLAAVGSQSFDVVAVARFVAIWDPLARGYHRLTIASSRNAPVPTTIVAIADAANEGRLSLESLATHDDEHVVETLTQIAGIGRWSAEYTLLRGLGRLHVFPGDDVGAQKNLARWLGLAEPLDYTGVRPAVAGWRPYAGLVYFHLLLDGLAARGELE